MIEGASAEYQALKLGCEEPNGLYDLLYVFDQSFPGELIEERLRAAKQALRDLVARGWVRLWYASWTSPDIETPIETTLVESTVENPHWWQNHIDRMVWFGATADGQAAGVMSDAELRAALANRPASH